MKSYKTIKKLIAAMVIVLFAVSCNDGIDPITRVDPGPDAGAPMVEIVSPVDGTQIDILEMESTIDVEFNVEDDIEIQIITVSLDGTEIASYDSFTDYRIFGDEFTQGGITFGDHLLTVSATDISGNVTTVTSTISKPPYSPMFANEVFYMPFDGNYTEFVSITNPDEVGTPGFYGDGFIGANAFQSATDSYLSFPMGDMLGSSFTGMFWYNVNSSPDRAGILVLGDPDTAPNNRTTGFRVFREGGSSSQGIKMNTGFSTGESWNTAATVNATTGDWVNVAFTVTPTETIIYLNGAPASTSAMSGPIDWTGCNDLVIGAGGPAFSYWNHLSDLSGMDELRFFNAALSQAEIQDVINQTNPYEPMYDGETFYMPFEGSYTELISGDAATEVGTPGFAGTSYSGVNAYAGATDSYLTFAPSDLVLGDEFSAAFWYKLNADPDRAGILTLRPPMNGTDNDLTKGFCFFRENAGGMQRFKLNVGSGDAGTWFDGGSDADIDPAANDWVHLAFTISGTQCVVYINGEVAKQGTFSGVDWTGCDVFSIMSGAPNFVGWSHYSDLSYMDELRLFNKELSQAEVQALMN